MSVNPIDTAIAPSLSYNDAKAAIRWLCDVLGFEVASLYEEKDGRVAYAQLVWGGSAIDLSSRNENGRLPSPGLASIVLTAPDAAAVDAIHDRAVAAGAEIVLPVEDTFYGSHGFSLRDPEGNHWHLGTPWHNSAAAKSLPERVV